MSSKANPKVIGAFVLGGIALLIAGLLAFGGTNLFRERHVLVAYFDGSLKGLRLGAAVTFRGVPIGQVTDIQVLFEPETIRAKIPVVFELDPDRVIDVGMDSNISDEDTLRAYTERGFRAQLEMDSLVTGLLSINLNFHEDATPVERVDRGVFALPYPEVPTMPSDMERLQAGAGQIIQEATTALNGLNEILSEVSDQISGNEDRLGDIIDSVAQFAESVRDTQPQFQRLLDEAIDATAAVGQVSGTANELLAANADRVGETLERLQANGAALARMADQVNNMVAENREGLRDFSQGGLYEISGLARDAQLMVDQITRVMEELERDPARFLFGDRLQGIQGQ
jgi:paraquat-inducible protein B